MERKLKVGDRVRVVLDGLDPDEYNSDDEDVEGLEGIVRYLQEDPYDSVGVDFDDWPAGHSLSVHGVSYSPSYNGWWVSPTVLQVISATVPIGIEDMI